MFHCDITQSKKEITEVASFRQSPPYSSTTNIQNIRGSKVNSYMVNSYERWVKVLTQIIFTIQQSSEVTLTPCVMVASG